MQRTPRAFSLIELLITLAVIAVLLAVLLPVLSRSRTLARQTKCFAVLQQVGRTAASYATDFRDSIFTFSWRPGSTADATASDADLRQALSLTNSSFTAHSIQGTQLLRNLADGEAVPLNPNWWPHKRYSHLVLQNYFGRASGAGEYICPSDRQRLSWVDTSTFENELPGIADATRDSIALARRWRYSSSYVVSAPATQQDFGPSVVVSSTHLRHANTFSGAGWLGGRRLDEVYLPSNKVWMFDEQSRHQRQQLFFLEAPASQPVLFFDTSVRELSRSASRGSGDPRSAIGGVWPPTRRPINVTYSPVSQLGDAPSLPSNVIPSRFDASFWYTEFGLRGSDIAP